MSRCGRGGGYYAGRLSLTDTLIPPSSTQDLECHAGRTGGVVIRTQTINEDRFDNVLYRGSLRDGHYKPGVPA